MEMFQNSRTKELWKKGKDVFQADVVTTMTKVLVYHPKTGELMASAGVRYARDFNYNSLIKIARQNSNIEVA